MISFNSLLTFNTKKQLKLVCKPTKEVMAQLGHILFVLAMCPFLVHIGYLEYHQAYAVFLD